jgi:phosphatidylserine decarboxylase
VLILVAGWGVGNITLQFDRGFRPRRQAMTRIAYANPPRLGKGEWLATFELGSTAILITERAGAESCQVQADQRVKYGQPLFAAD